MSDVMLTTTDNPYDPFTRFDEWYQFDEASGYHTCGLLARIAITSSELSEADQDIAIETAMDEIIEEKALGPYKKAFRT